MGRQAGGWDSLTGWNSRGPGTGATISPQHTSPQTFPTLLHERRRLALLRPPPRPPRQPAGKRPGRLHWGDKAVQQRLFKQRAGGAAPQKKGKRRQGPLDRARKNPAHPLPYSIKSSSNLMASNFALLFNKSFSFFLIWRVAHKENIDSLERGFLPLGRDLTVCGERAGVWLDVWKRGKAENITEALPQDNHTNGSVSIFRI